MTLEEPLIWTPEAEARLRNVPEGTERELTRQRVERLARQQGQSTVTGDLMEAKYHQWAVGSARAGREMAWTEEALGRMGSIPTFVRGMVVKAIEAYARKQGASEITSQTVDEARRYWGESGRFHQP